MAEKEIFSFFFGQKRGFSHFVLHVKRVGVEAQKFSDYTVSIGGRSLILDKNLYFLNVHILNLSQISCFILLSYPESFPAASSVWELER